MKSAEIDKEKNMNRVFLLGGKDLEMSTISDMLAEKKECFIDKHLSWDNAKLSAYIEEIKLYNTSEYIIYGIELTEDIKPPENYIRIDHHNDYDNKDSSLEQTAEILNYELDRIQFLIAKNDSDYIDGMINVGASLAEIQEVRLRDRYSQGVTTAEENRALLDIENNKMIIDDLIVVKTSLSKFSPITDRLYPYKQLIIYSNDELVYYGYKKNILVNCFLERISKGEIYYGGKDNGFMGTPNGRFTGKEIIKLLEEIKRIIL